MLFKKFAACLYTKVKGNNLATLVKGLLFKAYFHFRQQDKELFLKFLSFLVIQAEDDKIWFTSRSCYVH